MATTEGVPEISEIKPTISPAPDLVSGSARIVQGEDNEEWPAPVIAKRVPPAKTEEKPKIKRTRKSVDLQQVINTSRSNILFSH